jgi:hypothetical protein
MVRLFVNGEDYGLMSGRAAEMYLEVHRARYPEQPAHTEPVSAADAPDPEIGRELLVSDLRPPLVVVTGKDKSPLRVTMWVAELTPTFALMIAGEVGFTLMLTINPDGTLQDNTGEQVHIWEYLGEV